MNQKGIRLAIVAAVISGVSVYVNKFGVAQVSDPFIYTTLKNSFVAIGFLTLFGLLASWKELRTFTLHQWLSWVALGLIGGGIPFLLFFQGLATASAPSAALIQKTLFIWVALLAVPLLGEQLGWWQIGGLGALAVGQYFVQPTSALSWGMGETLILIATLMWAVETIVAKKVLAGMSARTAALGRMGIGAMAMWIFIALTGRAESATVLNGTPWFWVALTSVFLFGYVWIWYGAIKAAPATIVTTILTLGAIITVALAAMAEGKFATAPQIASLVLMVLGTGIFLRRPSVRPDKNPSIT